jgi:hypothetical protein
MATFDFEARKQANLQFLRDAKTIATSPFEYTGMLVSMHSFSRPPYALPGFSICLVRCRHYAAHLFPFPLKFS